MYISPNSCPVCWRGQYVGGVCSNCNHRQTSPKDRRPDALPLGAVVKQRYVIGEVLGNGGFGITYSAWDNAGKRRVALKELYPRKDISREDDSLTVKIVPGQENFFAGLVSRFENEGELLEELGKDCDAVQVYDRFRANGTAYYAMEFLDGCDLRTYLKNNGPMTWEFLEPRMHELLRTLKILHNKNLIHRDISPDNLFLTKDNRIRLIDFGSARTYQGNGSMTVFLKKHFAPWEQYKTNSKQGPYTDIYALSVTMYMMLSGQLPPQAPDRITGAVVQPLKSLCPKVPDKVCKAIEKGMNLRPEDRFQNAAQYLEALGVSSPPPPPPPPPDTAKRVYWLHGRWGRYSGKRKRMMPNEEITFGRLSNLSVTYPEDHLGVSRLQCSIFISSSGDILVRDHESTFGTFLNETRLTDKWTKVGPGSYIRFGSEVFQVYYTMG